ncbi:MFS transporter [Streptomyces sp. L7]
MVTLVQTASSLPIVLLALPSGVLADRFDRRGLLLVAQFAMFAVSGRADGARLRGRAVRRTAARSHLPSSAAVRR